MRRTFRLPRHRSFADITDNVELQGALGAAYDSVENVDAWVGMLAENHAPGAVVGQTVQRILSQQFEVLRDGDRFWYNRVFRGRALEVIHGTRLRNVIVRNTGVRNLQQNPFLVAGE